MKQDVSLNLPEKANRILNGILVVLLLFALRIWHVAVMQHEEKLEEARRPQRRVVIQRADRATIRDRFGIPLAVNKVQYQVGIVYGEIRDLPRWIWKYDLEGKRQKYFLRKEYIARLAALLGAELGMEADQLEDLIHAKAAILGNVPCMVKRNISEREYFRLKMLEKDWPGIRAEIAAGRHYPFGAIGGEVIGYLGAISKPEYESVTGELQKLRSILEEGEEEGAPIEIEDVRQRLKNLEGKAYGISDLVGKAGVEAACEEQLRGRRGKKVYLADTRGRFLSELPGAEPPTQGNCLNLTISIELQEYAEKLLALFDQSHKMKKQSFFPERQPWIKGGAIVAMDPQSGDILTLASFPRFDPNDFIQPKGKKISQIHQWLENENYLAELWDLKIPLQRERLDSQGQFYEESQEMGWQAYLEMILPASSGVRKTLEQYPTVGHAAVLQAKAEELFSLFTHGDFSVAPAKVFDWIFQNPDDVPIGETVSIQEKEWLAQRCREEQSKIEELKLNLAPFFQLLPMNYEKMLLVDLYRLGVDRSRLPPLMPDFFNSLALSQYRAASAQLVTVKEAARQIALSLFESSEFTAWREVEFKAYLNSKRKEEKAQKRPARPYVEYLDEVKDQMFQIFWDRHEWELVFLFLTGACREKEERYRKEFCTWHDEVGKGAHAGLPWVEHYLDLKKLIKTIPQESILPFLKSMRGYQQLERPLLGRYAGLRQDREGVQREKHLATAFYPTYGYGFARSQAFRQAATIGSIFKLVPAYEALRQNWMHGNEKNLNPLVIIDDKHRHRSNGWNVGYTADGRTIPMFYRGGRLPRSEHAGVGRVDLVKALEASSNPYFSLLAGDFLEDAEDLCEAAGLFGFGEKTGIDLPGEYGGKLPYDVAYNRTGLYAFAIGQHTLVGTPLQTAVMLASLANKGKLLKPKIIAKEWSPDGVKEMPTEVKRQVFLPDPIHRLLVEGMRQVIVGEKGTGRSLQSKFPQDLIRQIIGKTSTSECMEKTSLDGRRGWMKVKHVWFGCISYDPKDHGTFTNPELVVIVYLRFGEYGHEAAPLAVKVVQKWREIKEREGAILKQV